MSAITHTHACDGDCTLGDDGCCTTCGVSHAAPCDECGGMGFHLPTCSHVATEAEAFLARFADASWYEEEVQAAFLAAGVTVQEDAVNQRIMWTFPDGSAIVTNGDVSWDVVLT